MNATKEERRLAAQEVLREQRLLFQVLARGEDLPDHQSEASTSTAISTPGSSEKKRTVEVHEEEALVAVIEQKSRQEVKLSSPHKKPQQPQEKAQWQPKLNHKQGGNKGSQGINQVWVAKEEKGPTGHGRNRKAKGKGKNTTEQWRVKQVAEEQPTPNRYINLRGKKNHQNTGYNWYHYGY